MFIGMFILAAILLFGCAAAIQFFISPTELHNMGVWIDHPEF
jgi:hypothetical protein